MIIKRLADLMMIILAQVEVWPGKSRAGLNDKQLVGSWGGASSGKWEDVFTIQD